ncbi:cation:proton antiporter [Mahella australiensis]|uniref:Sodium/hydrogen exchanger n=1 Tax=Mahella australiensis (strain DSM 15567 / CIP 107919 / 50-1 BON) TaxID=697281 RepID=F3ZX12_MAHA5|nr:cation:proton antiporter [Mahella australiensis]AEE95461.1 sodium/hydrogen exchanger [Mahella australiensis 50-1 BON]
MESATYLLQLAILLIAGLVGAYISRKVDQPSVLGQIIIGIIIGPSLLNLNIITSDTTLIEEFANIGVVLLMFIAGVETDLNELRDSGKASMIIASTGVLVPMILGFAVAAMEGIDMMTAIFIGVILTATSVSITVQVLREIGKLKTRQGVAILGAAVIDDVLGIILLSVVAGMVRPGATENIWLLLGKMALFFVGAVIIGLILYRLVTRLVLSRIRIGESLLTLALIFTFIFSFFAEYVGVAAITGAYVAGLILSATPYKNRISNGAQILAYNLFTPIFFINIGLGVNVRLLGGVLVFGTLLTLAALIGKIVGCGIGAKISGFNNRESLQVGIGMMSRGEVGLIVASLGESMGIIGPDVYAAIIMMILISTLTTPLLLKMSFKEKPAMAGGNVAN